MVTSSNDRHCQKANFSILVTDEGIDNIFADSQLSNAFSPINSTEKGIIICFNDLHNLKAFPEILLTEDGIEISLSEMHPSKHDCSIYLNVGDWNVTSVSDCLFPLLMKISQLFAMKCNQKNFLCNILFLLQKYQS